MWLVKIGINADKENWRNHIKRCSRVKNHENQATLGDAMNGIQQNNDSQLHHMQESLQLSQFSGEVPTTLIESSAELPAVKLGIQAAQHWPQSRGSRLVALRTQVEAGTYQIKNQEVAQRMLINETHFFSVQAH